MWENARRRLSNVKNLLIRENFATAVRHVFLLNINYLGLFKYKWTREVIFRVEGRKTFSEIIGAVANGSFCKVMS